MSGPRRPFDPAELRLDSDGAGSSEAELAAARAMAAELEAAGPEEADANREAFVARVMAAIDGLPAPRRRAGGVGMPPASRGRRIALAAAEAWRRLAGSDGGSRSGARLSGWASLVVVVAAGSLIGLAVLLPAALPGPAASNRPGLDASGSPGAATTPGASAPSSAGPAGPPAAPTATPTISSPASSASPAPSASPGATGDASQRTESGDPDESDDPDETEETDEPDETDDPHESDEPDETDHPDETDEPGA
jgi:hypothetical protein